MSEIAKKPLLRADGNHAENDTRAIPSERRLKANRENAKKSTGPRTLRGKAFSSRNAIKHGLFVSSTTNFVLQSENSLDYEELRKDLRRQYKPFGRAEELEVERIAMCWWRLQHAWRFENAQKIVAGQTELSCWRQRSRALDEKDRESIQRLETLRDEIVSMGDVPADFKERVIAIGPELEDMWPLVEGYIEYCVTKLSVSRPVEGVSAVEVAVAKIDFAIDHSRNISLTRDEMMTEVAHDRHAVPNSDVLNRMLRYEAGIDRNLTRALDRLELLQRRRTGNGSSRP